MHPILTAAKEGNVEQVRALVSSHGSEADNHGATALHYAGLGGHGELVAELVAEHGFSIKDTNNNGATVVHYAAFGGHGELVAELVAKHSFSIKDTNNSGATVVHYAALGGHEALMVQLVTEYNLQMEARDNTGATVLHFAGRGGHRALMGNLVADHGFSINDTDYNGGTVLHHVALGGHGELMAYLATKRGFSIETRDNTGATVLHLGARGGHLTLVEHLLEEHDFSIEDENSRGETALHYALHGKQSELLKWLADNGIGIPFFVSSFSSVLFAEPLLTASEWDDLQERVERFQANEKSLSDIEHGISKIQRRILSLEMAPANTKIYMASAKEILLAENIDTVAPAAAAIEQLSPDSFRAKTHVRRYAELAQFLKTYKALPAMVSDLNLKQETPLPETRGSFGVVYHTFFKGQAVAVKKLKMDKLSSIAKKEFYETAKMQYAMNSPYIVRLHYASFKPYAMVLEYMPQGSLHTLLHRCNTKLELQVQLSIALDVSRGLAYLHHYQPTISHGALQSSSVLLDDNMHAKLCDFGFTRIIKEAQSSPQGNDPATFNEAYAYMAPEVLNNRNPSPSSDMYSFGVLLWEIVSRKKPHEALKTLEAIVHHVCTLDSREVIPDDMQSHLSCLILRCWEKTPANRPSDEELIEALSSNAAQRKIVKL